MLGGKIVAGSLSLSQPGGQLHPCHLKLLALCYGISLVLLAPALGLVLSLGHQPESVLTASSLLVQSFTGSVQLMLEVTEPSKEQTSLAGLIVAQSLHIVELGSNGGLLLGQDVQVVVKVSNNAEKVRVLARNLVLRVGIVSQGKIRSINLLVDSIKSIKHALVRLVS